MARRREFLKSAGLLTGGVCGGLAGGWLPSALARAQAASNAGNAPNILFILTDDQGWSQVSHPMSPAVADSHSAYLRTPNMTRLASEGMRFTSGYSPAPLCTPTRRSILCGMTTARQRGTEFRSEFEPAKHVTMPRALKQANPAYRCAHFGKWGEQMVSTPEQCGYDVSDGETGNKTGGCPGPRDEREKVYTNDDPKRTPSVTSRAIDFMRECAEARAPFYCQVSYYAVHLAVEVLEATLRKYNAGPTPDRQYTRAFAAMLEDLDTGVGRLLDGLDALGIAGNTYVVFMSDNGGRGEIPGGDDSRPPNNHPLSGAKQSLLEGGVRVPFLVRGPGVRPGGVCHVPVAGYDLLPTFYALAGGKAPLTEEIDGGSFTSLFATGEGAVRRPTDALIFHRPRNRMSSIRQGDDKLLLAWTDEGGIAKRQLFDVKTDPGESHDLAEKKPERAAELESMLTGYLEKVGAETPLDYPRRKKRRPKKPANPKPAAAAQ